MGRIQLIFGTILLIFHRGHGEETIVSNNLGGDTCWNDFTHLVSDPEVHTTFYSMLQRFNETCKGSQCSLQYQPVNMHLLQDYGALENSPFYKIMNTVCDNRFTSRELCAVNTKTKFITGVGDNVNESYILEKRKPVCFPSTCSDDQVYILDPNPARCTPDRRVECEVISYEVECSPERAISLETEKCEADALSRISLFFVQKRLMDASMMTECTKALSDKSSDSWGCSVDVGPITATTELNFTGFETDESYIEYEDACLNLGGQICFVDIKGESNVSSKERSIPNTAPGDVTFRYNFLNYPQCLPTECSDEHMEGVISYMFSHHLSEYDIECDHFSDSCNVTISDLSCKGNVASFY